MFQKQIICRGKYQLLMSECKSDVKKTCAKWPRQDNPVFYATLFHKDTSFPSFSQTFPRPSVSSYMLSSFNSSNLTSMSMSCTFHPRQHFMEEQLPLWIFAFHPVSESVSRHSKECPIRCSLAWLLTYVVAWGYFRTRNHWQLSAQAQNFNLFLPHCTTQTSAHARLQRAWCH